METGEINVSTCYSRRKVILKEIGSVLLFKMALGKVDLNKQIVILQNVWISTCNIFNSVTSFLTGRHNRQREINLKMLIADSNKRRNTKKKERKPPRYWVRPGRSNIW